MAPGGHFIDIDLQFTCKHYVYMYIRCTQNSLLCTSNVIHVLTVYYKLLVIVCLLVYCCCYEITF